MLLAPLLVLGLVQLGTSKIHLKRWDNLAVKHSWPEIPRGWEYKAPAPADYVFELRIGLKQDRIDDLIDNLMEISDPSHARYIVYFYCFHSLLTNKFGYLQHLTKEEAQTLVAPHPDSVEAVNSWLEFHDIDPLDSVHRSGGGDWVTLRIPVDLAEKMLGATSFSKHVCMFSNVAAAFLIKRKSSGIKAVAASLVKNVCIFLNQRPHL
jgi:tripeptidyl-peptidase I